MESNKLQLYKTPARFEWAACTGECNNSNEAPDEVVINAYRRTA